MTPRKREALGRILACPACDGSVDPDSGACAHCHVSYVNAAGKLCFDSAFQDLAPTDTDWLNRAKEWAKTRLPRIYPLLIDALSPVYTGMGRAPRLGELLNDDAVVLNVGAGASDLDAEVISIDIVPYPTVDVVASVERLPIRSNSADGVVSIAMIEHVAHPQQAVREWLRVLKPGGRIICFVPFMQALHASPYDFQRYTPEGLRVLFCDFEIDAIRAVGPTSGFVWVLQEWIALLLSFNSLALYRFIYPLTFILSPLKYLDVLLDRHPARDRIATGSYVFARKPLAQPN